MPYKNIIKRQANARKYYHANKIKLKEYYNEWAKIPKNKLLKLASARRATLKHNYGITEKEFKQLVKQQYGKCKICGNKPNKVYKKVKHLDVDHCHKTGKVRGLLCRACNNAIGLLQDDYTLVLKTARYLKKDDA